MSSNAVAGPGSNEMQCRVCGHTMRFVSGPTDEIVDIMRAFDALHRHCDKRQVFAAETTIDDMFKRFLKLLDKATDAAGGVVYMDLSTTVHDALITLAANYGSSELYRSFDELIPERRRS